MLTTRSLAAGLVAAATSAIFGTTAAAASPAGSPDALVPAVQVINLDDAVIVYEDGRVFRRREAAEASGVRTVSERSAMVPVPPAAGFDVATLTPAGVTALIESASRLGLLEHDVEYGEPQITDMWSSDLMIRVGDDVYHHDVYAPGYELDDDPAAQANRDDFDEFTAVLRDLDERLGREITDFEPWVPKLWVIAPLRWSHDNVDRAWPLDEEPSEGCFELPSDAESDTATGGYVTESGSVWTADAALPGDPRCRAAAPSTYRPTRARRGPG